MLTESWWIGGFILAGLFGGIGGYVASFVYCLALRRRTVSLEFELADLQDRLYREIKTRAAHAAVKSKKDDDEFLSKVTATAPAKPEPWWMNLVHSDLKGT